MRALMWFRADLRRTDNTALIHAGREARRGVIGIFLVSGEQWKEHDWSDVKVGLMLRTLSALGEELAKLDIPLLVLDVPRFEDAPDTLLELARKHECDALYFTANTVNEAKRDEETTRSFLAAGLEVRAFTDQTVLPPGSLQTSSGGFYTVFTPFKKAWIERIRKEGVPRPAGRPTKQDSPRIASGSIPSKVKGFDAKADLPDLWPAGERFAARRLGQFVGRKVEDYDDGRDFPEDDATSALSPYLTVGAISVRQCLHAAWQANGERLGRGKKGPDTWMSELIWREFYRHILVGFPRVCRNRPYRLETEKLRWREADDDFEAWCEGRTGYPIVDAGMRQLRETGWMHNRLRMITAMFLTKDLLIDWRRGEQFFMRQLVDGDLASNNGGWQWSASTGTDAAPYFRIFNPTTQGQRYDPEGATIRKYVPELKGLPSEACHEPHEHRDLLEENGIDYPEPIVDHKKGRERALRAFKKLS